MVNGDYYSEIVFILFICIVCIPFLAKILKKLIVKLFKEINDKNKIAQLRKGDKVLIIEDKDNWIKVSVLASQALKA